MRSIAKTIIEFLLLPPFKIRSKLSSQFFESLEKHEKIVFERINFSNNKKSETNSDQHKSPESANFLKPHSCFTHNSIFKSTQENKNGSKTPSPNIEETAKSLPQAPSFEKRAALISPNFKTSTLKSLFPMLFKHESSTPSQRSSAQSNASSPRNMSPMLRGMSALLKKPIMKDSDESKILFKLLKFDLFNFF